jgi:phosphomannomutase
MRRLHATDQLSARVTDLSLIAEAMARLRQQPPSELAGLRVVSAEDLSEGSELLPPTDGLRYQLAGDGPVASTRVIIRPSGTEPKLKCYLEAVIPVASVEALAQARTTASAVLTSPKKNLSAAAGIP